MQAGEAGVIIKIDPNRRPLGPNPVNITGATCALVVLAENGTRTVLALTLTGDSPPLATRTTLATDFPVPGNYQVQLTADYGGGRKPISPSYTLVIGPTL